MVPTTATWPPYTCVAAFLGGALSHFDQEVLPPMLLTQELGIRVAPGVANPFGLSIADRAMPLGLTSAEATQALNSFLRRHAPSLAFRHIPFLTITFGLYAEALTDMLHRSVYVGVGVDAGLLLQGSSNTHQHVFQAVELIADQITLWDPSHEVEPPHFTVFWNVLENAVLSVGDGYWVIGPARDLEFKYCLPRSLHENGDANDD